MFNGSVKVKLWGGNCWFGSGSRKARKERDERDLR